MQGKATPQSELSFRARKILYAVITEYIATGEPVGSRRLSRRYGLHLSPATIRNVLADLEELGFLNQPHTSAGRVPTDQGFRVFVDALVQMREVAPEDRALIANRLSALRPGDDFPREAGRMLSSMTGAAAVVTLPRPEQERLAQVRFIPLRETQVLAVLVTRAGTVQNRVVDLAQPVDVAELERVHNYLSEFVQGRTLAEIREALAADMETERGRYDVLRRRVRDIVEAAVGAGKDDRRQEVVIEGQGRLFDRPEFADAEKIRGFLRTFEEKERLLRLLDRTLVAGGVHVLIGAEAELLELEDVSVVTANYGLQSRSGGSLGIIGPTRMDYAKVVPLVGFAAQMVSDWIERGERGGDDDPE